MTSLAASAIKRILNLKVITKVPLRIVLIFLNVLAIVAPLPSHALARVRAEAQRADIVPLAKEIDRILGDSALTGGIQGLAVRSLRDGMTWYERNPALYFMPASNQKLLTSAAALHVLGPEFRYRTRLLHDGGAGRASELAGNIYIEGSGDATLEEKDLDSFVSAVKKAGFRRIRGNIIGDGSRFDSALYGPGWSWDYLSDYYAAPVSALNLNKNVVRLHVMPGSESGLPAKVAITPIPYLDLDSRILTSSVGTNISVGRELGQDRAKITGEVAVDALKEARTGFRVTVTDPAEYAAAVLKDRLIKAGVPVDGEAISGRIPRSSVRELAVHQGRPLSEILPLFNKPSDNLIGECLLKTIGAEKGSRCSFAGGREVAMRWFKEIGIPEGGFGMADGSGLSRLNVVTPRALAKLLEIMHSHPHARVFLDSLPVAGVDGTLRNRMKGTLAEGNCRAKTGYIGAVSSLSGYVTTRGSEPLVFVILMNNHRARNASVTSLQNRIVEYLASFPNVPKE